MSKKQQHHISHSAIVRMMKAMNAKLTLTRETAPNGVRIWTVKSGKEIIVQKRNLREIWSWLHASGHPAQNKLAEMQRRVKANAGPVDNEEAEIIEEAEPIPD